MTDGSPSAGHRGPIGAGLCDDCVHQRVVPTRRTAFSLCELSRADPRFPRYPPLPVRRCAGFAARPGPAARAG